MPTVDERVERVNSTTIRANEIRWRIIDARLFEDFDIDLAALSPEVRERVIALYAENNFLRIAWHAASERIPPERLDADFRAVCAAYREGLAATWRAESERQS